MTTTAPHPVPDASRPETLLPLAGELLAVDRWPAERLQALQAERLRALLRHAAARSPYYRELLGPDAGREDVPLRSLPTLSKATLMAEFDRIATDPRLRRDVVHGHATGPQADSLLAGEFRVCGTSGTTGEPALIAYSRAEFAVAIASALRVLVRFGGRPGMRVTGIGAPSPLHLSRQIFGALQSGQPGAPALDVTMPLERLVRELNAYQPQAVPTYPSIAGLLAQEQLAGRLRIQPELVAVGSEVLADDVAARIREAWGIEPSQVYATTEVPIVASGSPDGEGLHVNDDLCIVESVDAAGRPVPPGQPGHRVLVTNLVQHAQPLIRYELADSLVLADGADPSGRPYARILRIDGRDDEILRLPARAGGEVDVHPYWLRAPFTTLTGVRQYRIRHAPGRLRVEVVPAPAARRELLDEIRDAVRAAVEDAGAIAPSIDVASVDAIPRESGTGAKLRLVARLPD